MAGNVTGSKSLSARQRPSRAPRKHDPRGSGREGLAGTHRAGPPQDLPRPSNTKSPRRPPPASRFTPPGKPHRRGTKASVAKEIVRTRCCGIFLFGSGSLILLAATLLLDENLREAETTAGKILCIIVSDERNTLLADFSEINFPSHLRDQFRIQLRPRRMLLLLLLRGCRSLAGLLGNFLSPRLRGGARLGLLFRHRSTGWIATALTTLTLASAAFALDGFSLARLTTAGGRLWLGPTGLGLVGRSLRNFGGLRCRGRHCRDFRSHGHLQDWQGGLFGDGGLGRFLGSRCGNPTDTRRAFGLRGFCWGGRNFVAHVAGQKQAPGNGWRREYSSSHRIPRASRHNQPGFLSVIFLIFLE